MTIYTRRGDDGTTSLADGERVAKDDQRVEAYGTVDEANSAVGVARATNRDDTLETVLAFVQNRLMTCASMLATRSAPSPDAPAITPDDVAELERAIDEMSAVAGEFTHFVLPTGCEVASRLHVARTVVRRAERSITRLTASEPVDDQLRAFVNRSSDLLFAAARYANATQGDGDITWEPAR